MQRLLRLLAEQTRLRILAATGSEELAVNEIADVLDMSQPRISNHLRLLREAGALRDRREGAWTFYRNALPDRPESAALWRAVSEALRTDPALREDAERRRTVLERRRDRSRAHFAAAPTSGTSLALGCLREEILATLLPASLTAVDAGCGDGFLTELLAARFARVIAVDHSPERLEAARARLAGKDVDFRLGEVDALPVDSAAADACLLILVLHHVPRIGAALREARRVLRSGGRVVVADLAPHTEESLRERLGDLRLGLDPGELRAALRTAGFSDIRQFPVRDRLRAGRTKNLDLILMTGEHRGTVARRGSRRPPNGEKK